MFEIGGRPGISDRSGSVSALAGAAIVVASAMVDSVRARRSDRLRVIEWLIGTLGARVQPTRFAWPDRAPDAC